VLDHLRDALSFLGAGIVLIGKLFIVGITFFNTQGLNSFRDFSQDFIFFGVPTFGGHAVK
jgi:hypothetical protein